jgi:hypothetical protein
MKYLKMLGLAAVAAAGLMAFVGAGSASATTLTCTNPPGTKVVCPAGTTIESTATSSLLLKAGFAEITCTASTVKGKTSNAGSTTETVKGPIETLTFTSCGSSTVDVIKNGSLEIHTDTEGVTDGNGTVTGTGSEVTVSAFGTSCVYGTPEPKDLGTLKGSSNTGGTATFTISASLSKVSGGFLCANPAAWSGSYKVTNPDWLDVD